MPQTIPWVVGRGWEGAREAMARHEADDVCALVERDTSRVTCTLGEAIWPLCVLANVTGRGTAAGLGAHFAVPISDTDGNAAWGTFPSLCPGQHPSSTLP